ncbi:hypothetical protein ACSBL2_10875 [Pedobacter sp. AW31-3R]|uniref:hypothetical protein n=1 Tax=Pedobacter sp. AW31-3R TaxID=3445781 RepID=UPI003FA12400
MKKNKTLLVCLLLLNAFLAAAQVQKLNGVYVGAQLYNTPFNGMQIDHLVFYFRNDGTFSDKLNIPNWKTNVSGRYTVQNNRVQFRSDNETKKYKLSSNGNLESTSGIKHTLHKVKNVINIPAAAYESKTASSSGGLGTGMPNVAAFSSDFLYFDGKGNFSSDRSGMVGIGGDVADGTIGGKVENNDKAKKGRYKLSPGEITLSFPNGNVVKQSFFYSPPNEEDLIVVNGEFYFRQEEGESAANQTAENTAKERTSLHATVGLPSAAQLLNKLRLAYGAENIDKITTIKETSAITGNLEAISLTDLANNRLRIEIRQNGKLMMVKQMEANAGWQWLNGITSPLSPRDQTEIELSLHQGVLGLHQKLNKHFLSGTVSLTKDEEYSLSFFIHKVKVVYLIDKAFKMKANGYVINAVPYFSVYRNFIEKNGIKYPSVTESSDGKSTITVTTTAIEFNPAFTAAQWTPP